jgi:hypothetical protein
VTGIVETVCEEDDEDRRPWRVFRGDLVRDTAHMALREDCNARVDNSIGCVVGTPLKEDVVGYLGDVRKGLGRRSAGYMGLAP